MQYEADDDGHLLVLGKSEMSANEMNLFIKITQSGRQ
jgi:hypothetical protein